MVFRTSGFTAWFEDFEISMMGGPRRTSFDRLVKVAMSEFEICLTLNEISRMPLPDEIVFQFDLL
ncbi:hypothetical protein N9A42_00150 [bacterium]|jgi:hypothetical protein|nr:hypothetical protein [bacterium]